MESNNIPKKKVVFPLKKEEHSEGELRPEFVEKMKEQLKESTVKIKNY